jgi:predicted  nucleic acid-binding Zn-ribbon protein
MSAMPAPVLLEEIRKRKADKRTELDDLRMEVRAAGQEMVAMSERITNVLQAGDSHSAMHFAARLGALGRSYLTSGEPEHAA